MKIKKTYFQPSVKEVALPELLTPICASKFSSDASFEDYEDNPYEW